MACSMFVGRTHALSQRLWASAARHAQHLSHVDEAGKVSMVDVSAKTTSARSATAGARVRLGEAAFQLVEQNAIAKGDVLTVAKIAGINAAKQTSSLIPLCHNISIARVDIALRLDPAAHAIDIEATAKTVDRTGVEMEALVAASVAALTVYDMCKAVAKDAIIEHVRLLRKTGGKSGDFVAKS